jgi:hypothetical protein
MSRFERKTVIKGEGEDFTLKTPPAVAIAKLTSIQTKDPKDWEEKEITSLTEIEKEIVKRSYPDWPEEDVDGFVALYFNLILAKLPVIMGWMTEEEAEKSLKKMEEKLKNQNVQ